MRILSSRGTRCISSRLSPSSLVKINNATCPRHGLFNLKRRLMSKAKLTKLFDARYKVYFCERQLGISDMTETTKAVYELIANKDITIKRIVSHKYFYHVSLSTVKRSVVELLGKGLITASVGTNDKRERLLTIT